ncbi:hypothetical protein [Streptomyces ipomoeae]|uniref:hypothetical protein n=1 Tax=Streptomyces ipomoeae TaxID=103232 RepID=UPI001147149D|nr:hypothetical protein [Streptomyces ipomoeae]TQE33857.1 hypothetical protein Sipo7851_19675 [Streptomyces ipomoeae]
MARWTATDALLGPAVALSPESSGALRGAVTVPAGLVGVPLGSAVVRWMPTTLSPGLVAACWLSVTALLGLFGVALWRPGGVSRPVRVGVVGVPLWLVVARWSSATALPGLFSVVSWRPGAVSRPVRVGVAGVRLGPVAARWMSAAVSLGPLVLASGPIAGAPDARVGPAELVGVPVGLVVVLWTPATALLGPAASASGPPALRPDAGVVPVGVVAELLLRSVVVRRVPATALAGPVGVPPGAVDAGWGVVGGTAELFGVAPGSAAVRLGSVAARWTLTVVRLVPGAM